MKKPHVRQWIYAAAGISVAIVAGFTPMSVCANGVSTSPDASSVTINDSNDVVASIDRIEAVTDTPLLSGQYTDSKKMDDSQISYTATSDFNDDFKNVSLRMTESSRCRLSSVDGSISLPSISKVDVPVWLTSDGNEFGSEAEADAHAAAASPTYAPETRYTPYWQTSDGQQFSTEAEADAHADSAVPSVTASSKQVPVWNTSDGYQFDTESDAAAHVASRRPAVTSQVKVVHHDAVSHEEWKFGWDVDAGGQYYKWFPTEEEASDYWDQLRREHPGEAIGGYGPSYKSFTVVDVPAYDEDVTYWVCAGVSYGTEAEANAAADAAAPSVSASSKQVPVWLTSDGHEFDEESGASSYAASCRLGVSQGTGSRTVWVASTGEEFSSEAAAQAFCEANKVTVSASAKQVWMTTDGRTFSSEEEASRYVDSLRTVFMSRLYNPYSGEHFYTADSSECDSLVAAGWIYEGEGWLAPGYSDVPVFRLYNPYVVGGDHHYTMSEQEREALVAAGWRYEGTGWYSDSSAGVPVYRQYNPYAASGSHNYTVSKSENDSLVSVAWKEEGIAWYGR